MGSLYRQQLEKWVSNLEIKADEVLDVGGGQLPIYKRVRSWDVSKYKILDNDAQYKPDIFQDLNMEMENEAQFDALFCLEVMEYIWNPVQAHINLGMFLKPGGVAYISYPTWYPLHNPPGIDYLRYTKNAIEKLLSVSGFQTWEITPRIATDGVKALADFYSKEQMRPMRGTTEVFDIGYMVKAYKNKEELV